MVKFNEKYEVLNVSEPLFYYRKHSNSLSAEEKILFTRGNIYKSHATKRGYQKKKHIALFLLEARCMTKKNMH